MAWLRADDLPESVEVRDSRISIGDPALAAYLGVGGATVAGVAVNETSSMALTAVWRCVSLISGAVAGLPLKTYRDADGDRERVPSLYDDPGGAVGLTPFEWKELVLVHLALHGNAFLHHVYGGGGQLLALQPLHPMAVAVKRPETDDEKRAFGEFPKFFEVAQANGAPLKLSPLDLTHIPALSTDGLRGLSPIEAHRQALSCGLAGDRAAARMFGSGLLLGGLVSGDEDMTEDEAATAVAQLKAKTAGADHAGDIAWINANVKFTPWTVPPREAQFIESRVHQVEEVCRIYGVPPHLVGLTEKQTSWGTGVQEQNQGLHRYTLSAWTARIEERLSALLAKPRFVEFDYAGFLRPSPQDEIRLLIEQVNAGILTVDEARAIRNMAPLPKTVPLVAPQTPALNGAAP